MDKTKEYDELLLSIAADVSESAANLATLRSEIVPELEKELNDAKLSGHAQTIQAEVLRKYIQLTRDMQKFLFDNIQTHILTIERLADHILCRRAVLERDKKPRILHPSSPVKSAPPTGIFEKLQEQMKGMTVEQQEEFLKKLRGE